MSKDKPRNTPITILVSEETRDDLFLLSRSAGVSSSELVATLIMRLCDQYRSQIEQQRKFEKKISRQVPILEAISVRITQEDLNKLDKTETEGDDRWWTSSPMCSFPMGTSWSPSAVHGRTPIVSPASAK